MTSHRQSGRRFPELLPYQCLCIPDTLVCARDGDLPIVRAWHELITIRDPDLHIAQGLELVDDLALLTYDGPDSAVCDRDRDGHPIPTGVCASGVLPCLWSVPKLLVKAWTSQAARST